MKRRQLEKEQIGVAGSGGGEEKRNTSMNVWNLGCEKGARPRRQAQSDYRFVAKQNP